MTKKSPTHLLLALAITLLLASAWGYHQVAQAEGDGPITCEDGMAGEYPCDGIDYLSFMSIEELGGELGAGSAANLWGWKDPETNKEYVIFGLTDSTAFVDVTEPLSPTLIGNLPNQTSVIPNQYRDIKVYKDHAFIIADQNSEHGMQVFDLTQLRDVISPTVTFTTTAHFGQFNAHNLHINEDSGYAYILRTTTPILCESAIYMVNIQDPLNPTDAGCVNDGGAASDAMCVIYHGPDPEYQNKEICATASDDNIVVHDVSDKANPVLLADLDYSDIKRAHNTWFTEDHRFFLSSDMYDETDFGLNTRIFAWDVSDLNNPTIIDIYEADYTASDHNLWVKGDYAYIGNFHAGMRMLDISALKDGGQMTAGPFLDLFPTDDNASHHGGVWAIYPFFESDTIAVSGKMTGMYLLRPSQAVTAVSVSNLSSPSNSSPLALAAFALAAGLIALAGYTVSRKARL